MTDKTVNTTVEILGKIYPIRCHESEVKALQQAAAYLNQKMSEIRDSGKVINLERIAIITALNVTHKLLQIDHQKNNDMNKVNLRITQIQEKLDTALTKSMQTELIAIES